MNSSRHLLCLYPWLKLGGADKFNLDMLGQLRRRGWRATVVTTLPATHSWRAAFEPVCDQIIDIATTPPAEHPARLVQIIEVSRPDCALISHSSLGYAALPYLRAHYPELPFADYCHIEEPYWRDGGYPRMSLAQAAGLDLQIVSSDHLKAWMTERGGEPARIEVCSTNIDTADWNPARYDRARLRAEIGLPSDAHVVLYAARLERQKQPMLAARVIRAAIAGSARLHVLIAGDGLFGPYLQSYVRRHGLEGRARLLGAVSGERMRELLAISDVFFLPSLHEGISLAIYEAMAMGVAPVSANVGGQAELLTPECGVLIARGRDEQAAYTRALCQLAAEPARTRAMGEAARRRVTQHFPLDAMGRRMDDLLGLAIRRHADLPRAPAGREAARASALAAVAGSREDAVAFGASPAQGGARAYARAIYWRLIERGAWWLVPLADWARARRG